MLEDEVENHLTVHPLPVTDVEEPKKVDILTFCSFIS